tara:strand:+ start:5995 stop:6945 length:951 start_codon:yes stop_codon:yes gene_type:complete
MENALKLIEKHTDISPGTLGQYKSQLRSLYVKGSEYFGMDSENPLVEDLFLDRVKEDPENMINIINKNWKGGTAKTYLNVLIVYLRCLIHESQSASVGPTAAPVALSATINKYREVWKTFQKDYEQKVESGEMTEKQKETFLGWVEFDSIISDGMDKFGPYSIQVLTLMLYRYQPLRADYASVYYDPGGNKGGNYWTGEDLILNNYKTSKTYGKLVSPVSEFLEEYINKYIDENEVEEGEYFFPDKAESHISNNLLGKRIKNYFKQLGVENPPNLQQLRHIYLMNKYGAIKKEMDNDAFLMGHSKDTQNKYILKFE